MSNSGFLDTRFFFQPDEYKFIYSKIEDDLMLAEFGPLSLGAGLSFESFLGTGREDSGRIFTVRGEHWSFRGILEVDFRNLMITALAKHERYSSGDTPDSSFFYMSGLEIGIGNRVETRIEDHAVLLPAGYFPRYVFQMCIYHPGNATFRNGHFLDWSFHGEIDIPVLSDSRIVYGAVWHSDLYLHQTGSSMHLGEVYAYRNLGGFKLVLFLRRYLHDTQPAAPLHGETCLGLKFSW